MANSKPSRNAKALRNAPVYRAFSPKITHSIPRRPLNYGPFVASPGRGFLMIFAGSKLAEQNQDQHDNDYEAEPATTVG